MLRCCHTRLPLAAAALDGLGRHIVPHLDLHFFGFQRCRVQLLQEIWHTWREGEAGDGERSGRGMGIRSAPEMPEEDPPILRPSPAPFPSPLIFVYPPDFSFPFQ